MTFPVIRSCLLAGCRNLLLNLNNRGHTRVFARIGSHCLRCLGWHDSIMTLLSSARVGVYVQVVVCFLGCVGEKTKDTYFWKTLFQNTWSVSSYIRRLKTFPSRRLRDCWLKWSKENVLWDRAVRWGHSLRQRILDQLGKKANVISHPPTPSS